MTISREKEAEISRLFEVEKWKVGTIVSQLGVHEDVVNRIVGLLEPKKRKKRKRPSKPRVRKIDPYVDFVAQTLTQYPRLTSTRLHDMLVPRGYDGKERTLREYVATVRPRPQREAYVRLDPICAEQAQIDWMHVAKVPVPGGVRSLWIFVMVFAWSRAMWAEFVFDTTVHSLLRSLVRGMRTLGGSCRQWLFDNAKTVVLERYGDAVRFHPSLLDLAGQYHAQLRVCTPYKPNQKGSVERVNRYIRSRFLAGRTITSIEQGNRELRAFIDDIAHARPHPTWPEKTVSACLAAERERLLRLPEHEPNVELVKPIAVDKTASVRFDRNIYSVPPQHATSSLTLVADDVLVRLLDGQEQVACHQRSWGLRQRIVDDDHRTELFAQKRGARRAMGRGRLQQAVPAVDTLFERWVEAGRNVGSMTARTLKLLDLYGPALLAQAVTGATERGTSDPGALAQLCEQQRTQQRMPVPIDIEFGDHVPDRDVIPHDLGRYDENDENNDH